MTSLILLLFSFSLLSISYSAVFVERQRTVPGHENLCYDKEDNVFYKEGEEMKWKMKVCGRKVCRGLTGKGYVYTEIQTCGKVGVPPGCKVEINPQLSYPNCCERIICPETPIFGRNVS